jgi:hypothetical protein
MTDSAIPQARRLLTTPVQTASPWAALSAAGLAAVAAVLMAGVVVLGPGVAIEDRPVDAAGSPQV